MGELTDTVPKPMLPLGGLPLVAHQLLRLQQVGVNRVVLATGYLAEQFAGLHGLNELTCELVISHEDVPLGTGGALARAAGALRARDTDPVLVLNGDLLSRHDLRAQLAALARTRAELGCELVLHVREVADARAYGSVSVAASGRVTGFVEKSASPPSRLVSAGTYAVSAGLLRGLPQGVSSLEVDILPTLVDRGLVAAYREEAYFLDVGTPEALAQAQADLGGAP